MNRLSSSFKFFNYLLIILGLVIFAGWLNAIRFEMMGKHKGGLIGAPIAVGICTGAKIKGSLIAKIKSDRNIGLWKY